MNIKTAICTLFEGDYHKGVAALANSLFYHGYRGDIYVGYLGSLPPWATHALVNNNLGWEHAKSLTVADGLQLHFLPLSTSYSLTNYKPDFLLELLDNQKLNIDNIFYFDPDITLNKHWNHFVQWINAGVALCEDVNSPIPKHHPRRVGWRNFYKTHQLRLNYKSDLYVNGGFIGLKSTDKDFLKSWKLAQELMAIKIGGLERSIFSTGASKLLKEPGFNIFDKTDQDALNVAVELTDLTVSLIGKEAMGFKIGDSLMFHSLGQPKPWQKNNFFELTVNGRRPSQGQKVFIKYLRHPIKVYPKWKIWLKKMDLFFAVLFSRIIG